MAKKIGIVNGKGGVGKSNLTSSLAAALAQKGSTVKIIDRDRQRTSSKTAERIEIPQSNDPDVILIDTAPDLTNADTLLTMKDSESDYLLLITSPSPDDLDTTLETAEKIKSIRKDLSTVRIVLNNVHKNTRIARSLEILKEKLPFPCIPTIIPFRPCYQAMKLEGWKALTPDAKEELYRIIVDILTIK